MEVQEEPDEKDEELSREQCFIFFFIFHDDKVAEDKERHSNNDEEIEKQYHSASDTNSNENTHYETINAMTRVEITNL